MWRDPACRTVLLGGPAAARFARAENAWVDGSTFREFFDNAPGAPARVSVARLTDEDRALFKTVASDVWLSRTSLDEHKARHPEVTAEDYSHVPQIVRDGQVWAGHKKKR